MLKLPPRNLRESGAVFAYYAAIIPAGVPFSALFQPEYWAHHASKLRPMDAFSGRAGDVVNVVAEDGSFDEELRVVGRLMTPDKSRAIGVKMRLRHMPASDVVDRALPAAGENGGYLVKWRGPHAKWSVLGPDRGVVSEKHESEEEAHAALNSFLMDKAA